MTVNPSDVVVGIEEILSGLKEGRITLEAIKGLCAGEKILVNLCERFHRGEMSPDEFADLSSSTSKGQAWRFEMLRELLYQNPSHQLMDDLCGLVGAWKRNLAQDGDLEVAEKYLMSHIEAAWPDGLKDAAKMRFGDLFGLQATYEQAQEIFGNLMFDLCASPISPGMSINWTKEDEEFIDQIPWTVSELEEEAGMGSSLISIHPEMNPTYLRQVCETHRIDYYDQVIYREAGVFRQGLELGWVIVRNGLLPGTSGLSRTEAIKQLPKTLRLPYFHETAMVQIARITSQVRSAICRSFVANFQGESHFVANFSSSRLCYIESYFYPDGEIGIITVRKPNPAFIFS